MLPVKNALARQHLLKCRMSLTALLLLLLLPPPAHVSAPCTAGGPHDDESAAKRPRLDFVLTAEDEFLAEHGEGPSKVQRMTLIMHYIYSFVRVRVVFCSALWPQLDEPRMMHYSSCCRSIVRVVPESSAFAHNSRPY
jgi:hypothetical protein